VKTYITKPGDFKREWHLVDAADKTLGRLSVQIVRLLMGKHRPTFTPNEDTGDFVVVINAAKVRVTGNKLAQKVYYRHSNYPGGFKSTTLGKMMEETPTRALEHSVKGMLPHTRLGDRQRRRLLIYAGAEQPHMAQKKAAAAKPARKTARKEAVKEAPKAVETEAKQETK
jgi:large subunit ribosomal protein L13